MGGIFFVGDRLGALARNDRVLERLFDKIWDDYSVAISRRY
ncbi:hypothetical protein [Picosynechococcus sp. NKBG15041c]|nr:hypothetical protein [Picosynechococcus sp. NKBG15041c]